MSPTTQIYFCGLVWVAHVFILTLADDVGTRLHLLRERSREAQARGARAFEPTGHGGPSPSGAVYNGPADQHADHKSKVWVDTTRSTTAAVV